MAQQKTNPTLDQNPATVADLTRVISEIVPGIIRQLVPDIIRELVPDMIRRGTDDIRAELAVHSQLLKSHSTTLQTLQGEVSSQGMQLKAAQIDLSQLKSTVRPLTGAVVELQGSVQELRGSVHELQGSVQNIQGSVQELKGSVRDLKESVYRLEVLGEDFDHRMQADGELLRQNLNVRDQVRDHETRLGAVESLQTILKGTVRDHSKKLKSV